MLNVAIIGGGPVGTMCAIRMMEQCSGINVHVFEQRPVFTRKQILALDQQTMNEFLPMESKMLYDNLCYVVLPKSADTKAKCYRNPSSETDMATIRISKLEQILWEAAKRRGAIMHRPQGRKLRKLRGSRQKKEMTMSDPILKNFDIIIGAGGSKDIVREYLNIEMVKEPVGYTAIITWKPSNYVTFDQRTKPVKKIEQNRYRMFRSRKNNNFYGAIQLNEEEYEMFKDAPRKLSEIADENVLEKIASLMRYYNVNLPDEFVGEGTVMAFPIVLHRTKRMGGIKSLPNDDDEKLMLLIGDAVTGVHFFSGTGVNTGFRTANSAAQSICLADAPLQHDTMNSILEVYERAARQYVQESYIKSKEVILKVDEIFEHCYKDYTLKELHDMAASRGYHIFGLPKDEICLIMGNEFIDPYYEEDDENLDLYGINPPHQRPSLYDDEIFEKDYQRARADAFAKAKQNIPIFEKYYQRARADAFAKAKQNIPRFAESDQILKDYQQTRADAFTKAKQNIPRVV